MPRRRQSAHRRDDNHGAIVEALEGLGWHVQDTSQAGNGCPDVFAVKGGRVLAIEIKDGRKKPSARKLSPKEESVHAAFAAKGCPVLVIESVEDVIAVNLLHG